MTLVESADLENNAFDPERLRLAEDWINEAFPLPDSKLYPAETQFLMFNGRIKPEPELRVAATPIPANILSQGSHQELDLETNGFSAINQRITVAAHSIRRVLFRWI